MTNETNKPNASQALTRPTDLITCGLYIPHDKLVGIIKNINEIEGLKSAYITYRRMCRFCASVEGWHESAAVIEGYLVEEKRKKSFQKSLKRKCSLFRSPVFNFFLGDTDNVYNNA